MKDKSIYIQNIYYMLAYAFSALDEGDPEDMDVEEFDNIYNLFAAILANGISRLLKQGVYRQYVSRKEDDVVVRGKIDMAGIIRNRLSEKRVVTCEYDELSENNLLNQILKTTGLLLLKHADVKPEYKNRLKREMLFFSNVDTVSQTNVHWSDIRYQRNNKTYRLLVGLCQLIWEGMLLTTETGKYKLASFVDEQRMSRLFEKFVLAYFVRDCPQVKAHAAQIPWAVDDGIRTMLPVMQSDITLRKENKVLIIDTKYYAHVTQKQYNAHTLHSHNLYQIFTYVKNMEAELDNVNTVSGMLLYAATDEDVLPDNVYYMSGNKIAVLTLDLNQRFPEIAKKLNEIATDFL